MSYDWGLFFVFLLMFWGSVLGLLMLCTFYAVELSITSQHVRMNESRLTLNAGKTQPA